MLERRQFLVAGIGVIATPSLASAALLPGRTSMATILIDKNVMVPMRDGVRLATDVYRLDGATPAPVLITRTPYDKERAVAGSDTFDILRAVQAGYAVVIQDVRGRYASEGEFDPMIHETRDGVYTFAWAASQPWSRGVVGTFGGSYLGATQWLPAREQPPALRAMAPSVVFSDMYEGSAYQGGAKVLHDLRWVVEDIIPGEIRRRVARGGESPEGGARLDLDAVLSHLPLADHPLIRVPRPSTLTGWRTRQTRIGTQSRPAPATSRSAPRCSTSAGGTISSCGARSRITRACSSGEVRNTRAGISA